LHKTKNNTLGGIGSANAKILFIQESPSFSEDLLGKAFISDGNKILKEMIVRAGISPTDCFFTYMVHCRACIKKDDMHNRLPNEAEILACMPNVLEIIQMVRYNGIVFIDALVEKYYKSKITVPHITLTSPNLIKIKGGKASNLFIDNLQKLERFYDKITSQDL
jgi:uracil-DNA glycosylase family 4